jgi:hypothetical protein
MLLDASWEKHLLDPKPGWSDSTHFSPAAGNVMLRDLNSEQPHIGVLIDRHSLAAHVTSLDSLTRAWQGNNPDFLF